jgi:DNA polymerase III alpha subunit (gram-positive type)
VAARRCPTCRVELVAIRMVVDGNDLVMESCEKCDVRRWQLAGQEIDLQQALAEVGEHAGRRR